MTFGIPLSHSEKLHIAQFPELSHGDVARSLNRLFKNINRGTRSRDGVYLFRKSDEYQEYVEKIKEKEKERSLA